MLVTRQYSALRIPFILVVVVNLVVSRRLCNYFVLMQHTHLRYNLPMTEGKEQGIPLLWMEQWHYAHYCRLNLAPFG
jgi:hypothetical protein